MNEKKFLADVKKRKLLYGCYTRQEREERLLYLYSKHLTPPDHKHTVMPSLPYPEFKIVSIIAGACLKHSDSGESSFNKEARVILMELENNGYEVVKRQ